MRALPVFFCRTTTGSAAVRPSLASSTKLVELPTRLRKDELKHLAEVVAECIEVAIRHARFLRQSNDYRFWRVTVCSNRLLCSHARGSPSTPATLLLMLVDNCEHIAQALQPHVVRRR